MGDGDPSGQGGPLTVRCRAQRRASRFRRGRHASWQCRSWASSRTVYAAARRSIAGGFAFAAAIAAIGFASSLEILSATAFLAGMTSGVMDVAMNANASDVERRWGRPLMSSFHAAFSLGGAAGALLGGWLGARGTALGLLGPALLSSLLVAHRGSVPHA